MAKNIKDFILSFGVLGSILFEAAQKVRDENVTTKQLIYCVALDRLKRKHKLPLSSEVLQRQLNAAVFDYATGRKDVYDEIDEFTERRRYP